MRTSIPLAFLSISILCGAGCSGGAAPTSVTPESSAATVTPGTPDARPPVVAPTPMQWQLEAAGVTDPLVAIGGNGPDDVWIAGSHSIIHGDGSGSWKLVSSNPDDEYKSLFVDGQNVYVAGMPCSGGVCQGGLLTRSSDGGQSWQRTTFSATAEGVSGDGHEVYLVLDGELRVASDDFANARVLPMPVTKGIHADGSSLLIYGGLRSFAIDRSSDGGSSWSSVYNGGGGSQTGHVDDMWSAGDTLFAVANGSSVPASFGALLRSSDGGGTWSTVTIPSMERASAVWGSSITNVYVLGSQLLHSADCVTFSTVNLPSGATWQAMWGSSASDVYVIGFNGVIAHGKI